MINKEQRDLYTRILAKAVLLNLPIGEVKFMEYQLGMSGSFYKHLFDLFWHADRVNVERLELAFPDEIEAIRRFSREEGYWEDLQQRVGIYL